MTRCPTFACALLLAFGAPAQAQNAPSPAQPPATAAQSPSEKLDELFARLASTEDADESAGIVAAIDRIHLRSGSDTSDLLMARAVATMESGNYPVSLALLDAIVGLQPEWAEGWNKRATARYLAGDAKGAMADIAQTLARDPQPSRRAGGNGNDSRGQRPSRTGLARLRTRPDDRSAMAPGERSGGAGEGRPRGSGAVTARAEASPLRDRGRR